MVRELLTARLVRKLCISEVAQCYHFEFAIEGLESFPFTAGQFISAVARDPSGKQQTRAYSISSAAKENRFELCVNRVENGFFSNYLCDLREDDTIQIHGPHGHFILHEPVTDSILVATGTGVAPMRGYAQWLFPENSPDRSQGRDIWLVYGTRHETDLYYEKYFEKVAAQRQNFRYLRTLSRPQESWEGLRGYVQDHVAEIVQRRAEQNHHAPVVTAGEPRGFDIHAYICGLNDMVSANRDRLKELGWDRKQIIFERYD